jgi:hypothetical protein
MAVQSLADGEDVSKPSSSQSSSSSLTQPQGTGGPGKGSSWRSIDVDGRVVGLPDRYRESTEHQRHPVATRLTSRSSSSSSPETGPPRDSSMPLPTNSDIGAVKLPDMSVESTGDQQHTVRMKSKSRSSSLSSPETVPPGNNNIPRLDNLGKDLRPQYLPLPPSPAFEVRRSFESGTGSVHHGSGSAISQQVARLKRRPESFGSDKSDYGSQDDRWSYASSFRASPRVLHRAWTTTEDDYKYRHIVTGEIFHHRWREPEKPGPLADDIPEGWTAQLVSEDEEDGVYVHNTTLTVIDVPPESLPEAIMKQFDLAATHGKVPQYCQGQLEGGQLMYKCINPSRWCPNKWRTAKRTEVIENEMNHYLANMKSDPSTPATVTFLAKSGQQIPFDLEISAKCPEFFWSLTLTKSCAIDSRPLKFTPLSSSSSSSVIFCLQRSTKLRPLKSSRGKRRDGGGCP